MSSSMANTFDPRLEWLDAKTQSNNPPLPGVEVSPQMFWHRRTDADPLQVWVRAAIRDIAAGNLIG
jgi:hypothetical protein